MNLGKIINPMQVAYAPFQSMGADLSKDQENMLNDWGNLKFQKGDIALSRGVVGKGLDSLTPGLNLNEQMTQWFDRKMPNTFGNSEGDTSTPLDTNGQPLTGEALAQFYSQKGY